MKGKIACTFVFIVLFNITCTFFGKAFSQNKFDTIKQKKNTIFYELFGNGLATSMNYERILLHIKKVNFSGRIGATFVPKYGHNDEILFSFPFQFSFFYGKRHFVELGAGYTYFMMAEKHSSAYKNTIKFSENYVAYNIALGYRFQKKEGGLFFKSTILKFITWQAPFPGFWFSLGIGTTF